jgi:hypothetical protein
MNRSGKVVATRSVPDIAGWPLWVVDAEQLDARCVVYATDGTIIDSSRLIALDQKDHLRDRRSIARLWVMSLTSFKEYHSGTLRPVFPDGGKGQPPIPWEFMQESGSEGYNVSMKQARWFYFHFIEPWRYGTDKNHVCHAPEFDLEKQDYYYKNPWAKKYLRNANLKLPVTTRLPQTRRSE